MAREQKFLKKSIQSTSPAPPRLPGEFLVVAHAGLAMGVQGAVPSQATINVAVAQGAGMIEVDVIFTKDLIPIITHELQSPVSERPFEEMTYSEVQSEMPWIVTLEECLEYIDNRVPVMLDLRVRGGDVDALHELSKRLDAYVGACQAKGVEPKAWVCSKDLVVLGYLQTTVPAVGRWVTLPQVDGKPLEIARQVMALLIKNRKEIGWEKLRNALVDSLRDLPRLHQVHWESIVRLPWGQGLSNEITKAASVGATGLCVKHELITPELAADAKRMNLPILAWVFNDPNDIAVMTRLGVAGVTTDRPGPMRAAYNRLEGPVGPDKGVAA